MNRFFRSNDPVRIASSVQTTHPDAARALEESWQRRRQELAGWQPSRGWLADVQPSTATASSGRK